MDFSSGLGLGLSFGTDHQEEAFNNGDAELEGASDNASDGQDQDIQDTEESPQDSWSFESQLDDPDTTPRQSSSSQFSSNNPVSFGAPLQSFSQPYRLAQPGAPFNMNANFEYQPTSFDSDVSGRQSYTNSFPQEVQNLQFGGDSRFNGHGHPQSGFQNMSQPGSDSRNAFGNLGMQSQQYFNNDNSQKHMLAQPMHQSNIKGQSQNLNTFQMTGYSSSSENQAFDGRQMNQHEFDQQTPRINAGFQPYLGSLMNSQFQPMSNTTHQMSGNPFGSQLDSQDFGSSFAAQGDMNHMHHNAQSMASSHIKNDQRGRSNFPFTSANSKQDRPKANDPNVLNKPAQSPNASSIGQQQRNINIWVVRKMRELGMNPRNPVEVKTFKDRCLLQKAEVDRRRAEMERAQSSSAAASSRVSSSSTVVHHPMDHGMGQGQPWPHQFGQGHAATPFQPQGNATMGPQMHSGNFRPVFPPVPPHLVLGSNNARTPVFGQDYRDYTNLSMNAPIQPDPRPHIPSGSAQAISDNAHMTNQQLRHEIRPPAVHPDNHNGGQSQQGSWRHHAQPLHPGGNAQFNQFGAPQRFHHHGLPPEYIPPHGYHPAYFADNGDESAEPTEEDEDAQQQEEASGPEQPPLRAGEDIEVEEYEFGDDDDDEEVDSDGFSLYSDVFAPSPPNLFPIPRPPGVPPSPIPRFPSNEFEPDYTSNMPPPLVGGGYQVWGAAPNAFHAEGHMAGGDKAKRTTVDGMEDCDCGGRFHTNGKGVYIGPDRREVWCSGGDEDDERKANEHGEKGETVGEDGDADGEDSEEDEELRGVPIWVKQVLTHGPRIDQNEARREEEAYRAMMAEKAKSILAIKAVMEMEEDVPGETAEDALQHGLRENNFAEKEEGAYFDNDNPPYSNDEDKPEPELQNKGKRKASAIDAASDEEAEVRSPVKRWKGKGKAADSDEELDERELERKYSGASRGKGKAKNNDFQPPPDNGGDQIPFDSSAGINLGGADGVFGDPDFAEDHINMRDESAATDPDLAASGILLPTTFPLPTSSIDDEEIEEVPRQALYQNERNKGPFNIFQSIILTTEITLELVRYFSPKQLLALYCTCRRFNEILTAWMAHGIRSIVKYQAPYSYKIYPFVLYPEISVIDPLGQLNQSGRIRRVPGLKYHQMVLHRVRAVRDILAALARKHLRCPPGTNHSLKKVWFLMDIPTTLDRVRLMHNRDFFTNDDLYNIQHFIVKLDMRLNDPMDGPGSDFLRKLMLGQRGLSPLFRLLTRTGFTNMYEMQACIVRYTYTPMVPAADVSEGMFGVPCAEIGRGHLEGWGKGEKHLMRIDELVMREATRREMRLKEHIAMMLLWGYVDPITGENLKPSERECYMSDGEGEEAPGEGDPWEGSGMNLVELEAEILGKEESDDEEEEEGEPCEGEDEDDDEEGESEDFGVESDDEPGEGPSSSSNSNSRSLWTA
ncbi:hypothetical protein DSL72_006161 [Monilinia vaccinii-corymbosi]|uniref:F-box domain-containing protein n=1 Tax=Monilinia vaccinii-corymbosi TaxID=61207 RepID=A0A8A3PGY9_9HELO|nr:hypothetical protein DSL72_006161 [Monilinia vaccinii-corymbosi]